MSYSPPLAPPNNSLALASNVLGWISAGLGLTIGFLVTAVTPLSIVAVLLISGVPGLLAIVFGFIGISTANRLGGLRKGMALIGVILGFLPLFAFVLGFIIRGVITG